MELLCIHEIDRVTDNHSSRYPRRATRRKAKLIEQNNIFRITPATMAGSHDIASSVLQAAKVAHAFAH